MMMMVRTTALVALCLLACGSITSTALAQQGHADESSLLRSHSRQLQFEEPVLIMEGEDLMLDQHNETDHAEGDHESELVHTNETDHAAEEDDHMDEYYHDDEDHDDEDEDHDHDHDHNDTSSSSSAFLGSETDDDKPWGDVIVASLLINMVTLMGVFFVTGEFVAKHICKRDVAHSPAYHAFTHNIIPSFACGALLATTVFLVLPESLLLITSHFVGHEGEEGHEGHRFMEEEGGHEDPEDGAAAWRFGSCVIGGFLLPVLTSLVFPHNHEGLEHEDHDSHGSPAATVEETNKLQDVPEELVVEDDDVPEEEEEFGATATTKSQMENKASNMTNASAGSLASDDSADLVVTTEDKTLPHAIDWSLAASIIAGDFFHNFAGTFIVHCLFVTCLWACFRHCIIIIHSSHISLCSLSISTTSQTESLWEQHSCFVLEILPWLFPQPPSTTRLLKKLPTTLCSHGFVTSHRARPCVSTLSTVSR